MKSFILASSSKIRAELLANAGLDFAVDVPRIDEERVRLALKSERANPRDVADTLAELKAQKISHKRNDALVLGCDQVLEHQKDCLSKPATRDEALDQLKQLRGSTHRLLSAAVLFSEEKAVWRHVGVARLHMRDAGDDYLESYVERNWDEIQHCVGCYQLEKEGARLFHRVEGDYFTILGLPLLELLSYLTLRGTIDG